jgi:hypothetical protein
MLFGTSGRPESLSARSLSNLWTMGLIGPAWLNPFCIGSGRVGPWFHCSIPGLCAYVGLARWLRWPSQRCYLFLKASLQWVTSWQEGHSNGKKLVNITQGTKYTYLYEWLYLVTLGWVQRFAFAKGVEDREPDLLGYLSGRASLLRCHIYDERIKGYMVFEITSSTRTPGSLQQTDYGDVRQAETNTNFLKQTGLQRIITSFNIDH